MSVIIFPKKAKFIVVFFLKNRIMSTSLVKDIEVTFGPIDIVSRWIVFDYTTYYSKEMSGPLYKRIFVFKKLIQQIDLPKYKLITNDLEKKYTNLGNRLINIDPGYLLAERFVLATAKNYFHRIYIGSGIYADLSLVYKDGFFETLPWTYCNYTSAYLKKFMLIIRKKYIFDLKHNYNCF